jgi:hypothetical protein
VGERTEDMTRTYGVRGIHYDIQEGKPMLSFFYTTSEDDSAEDGSGVVRSVDVYQIKDNIPELIGTKRGTFTTHDQLAFDVLDVAKVLPPEALAQPPGGARKFKSVQRLKDEGIAHIVNV